MRLILSTDERVVIAEYTARPEHIGLLNTLHGGITSTLLDEAMAWACAVSGGIFAYCAELTVRFRSPIRPDDTVRVVGRLEENRKGRLMLTSAEIRLPDQSVAATATGKYIPVDRDNLELMRADFVGDPETVSTVRTDGA